MYAHVFVCTMIRKKRGTILVHHQNGPPISLCCMWITPAPIAIKRPWRIGVVFDGRRRRLPSRPKLLAAQLLNHPGVGKGRFFKSIGMLSCGSPTIHGVDAAWHGRASEARGRQAKTRDPCEITIISYDLNKGFFGNKIWIMVVNCDPNVGLKCKMVPSIRLCRLPTAGIREPPSLHTTPFSYLQFSDLGHLQLLWVPPAFDNGC